MNWTLKKAIVESRYSAAEIAESLGCHQSQLSHYIRGRRTPCPEHKRALSKILGYSQADLFESPAKNLQKK